MRGRLPLALVLAGVVLMATGTIITVTLLVRRDNCGGVDATTDCQGYTNTIHWTFPLILLGAACIVAAGLSATNLVQRHRRRGDRVTNGDEE
jgi:hypothetical protein